MLYRLGGRRFVGGSDHLDGEDLAADLVRGKLGGGGEVWREHGQVGEMPAGGV